MLTSPPDSAHPVPAPQSGVLAEAAEEIRAWFVQRRGGAPFLSSADGTALLDWLEAGVPVSRILRAIDATAARRRARRSRRPFALRDIRHELRKAASGPGKAPVLPLEPTGLRARFAAALSAVGARITSLPGEDPEAKARAACTFARAFFDEVWAQLDEEREVRIEAAAAELEGLRADLGDEPFRALAEEVARDHVRAEFPELSAHHIWLECDRVRG